LVYHDRVLTLALRPRHHRDVKHDSDRAAEAPAPGLRLATDPEQPLYEQAVTALAERIASGVWRPGSRLPSERSLSASLGISRLTLRRALEELEHDGLIGRGDNRGWRVASGPISEPPNELLGFSAFARARGLTPGARVLTNTVREATLDEAELLRIAPGAQVFELERLRLFDTVPIAVNRAVIPLSRAFWLPEIDFASASLHDALESGGIRATTADYSVEVLDADERLANLLDVPIGKGLLLATGVTLDQTNTPIELGWIAYRPDRYRLRTTLTRRLKPAPPPA
jgi:GntR family transcriptional regulator